MVVTKQLMTKDEAQAFRDAWSADVKALSRMTRVQLAQTEKAELAGLGYQRLAGGPQTKDELVNAILEHRYGYEALNESTHVLYHQPGENWSACQWCGGVARMPECAEKLVLEGNDNYGKPRQDYADKARGCGRAGVPEDR